ncbi:MAG: helicase [Myxococcales bacterium]|nr:helicase [Myxococcales bacterium]
MHHKEVPLEKSAKTSAEVRQQLIDALQLDLIGPTHQDKEHQEEVLPNAPSKWYLTGFLVPSDAPLEYRQNDEEDEGIDELDCASAGDDDTTPETDADSQPSFFPSSIGLSVLVREEAKELDVVVEWGDYHPCQDQEILDKLPKLVGGREPKGLWGPWKRAPRKAEVCITLDPSERPRMIPLEAMGQISGMALVVTCREVGENPFVPKGTRSVSVFLVNQRMPAGKTERDLTYAFQAQVTLRSMIRFVARPDVRGKELDDWDEKVADLQYRNDFEFAVGHNVSALAYIEDGDASSCYKVQTTWLPSAAVEKVIPVSFQDVELRMEQLAEAKDAETISRMIGPLVESYERWIESNRILGPLDDKRRQVALELLKRAELAKERIRGGLQALSDPKALLAFQIANRAMARAARQRFSLSRPDKDPEKVDAPMWRPFQLAFVLMNLQGICHPAHKDRELVDLLFFPTGGGKTEAYLGLAAFTLVLRRLRYPGLHSAGLSVLMRYTLRLLTLDQLGRAATLVCALELERQHDIETLGTWPFEIGLWVGQSATPNRMGKKGDKDQYSARKRTMAFQTNDKINPSPIPLENCPWCGTKFERGSFQLLPNPDEPKDLRIQCANKSCTYGIKKSAGGRSRKAAIIEQLPLPILAIDEPIYRRLPCFLIATVDKFASLPWVGQTAGLFGRVERYDQDGFYSAAEKGIGQRLEGGLPPPDLVIQDELHLISGPLGTMVGLYETALDELSTREEDGHKIRPKIVASTATVRRANKQIRALFGRNEVDIFPPPGPNRRDSFFAQTVSPEKREPRLYVGVAAPGRNSKVVLLRTYLTLLGAAQKAWLEAGGAKNEENPADPYMTLLGYFGSLRELGGSRRIVEDEVNSRLINYSKRHRLNEVEGLFADRKIDHEPVELTSRVSTNKIAESKHRMSLGFHEKDRVDVALATNMISVGLDITRLGLMVVLNQPKMTAEYIQATSRVGRDDKRAGLVVTLLNVYRPRDRSHFERFQAWHTSFYRAVEATSVTPFSPRAIDRGLASVTVALARLGVSSLTAPQNALEAARCRNELDFIAEVISQRAESHDKDLSAEESEEIRKKIRDRVMDLLDTWAKIAMTNSAANAGLQYQREMGKFPPLLRYPLDPELTRRPKEEQKFKSQRSLRDVEQVVNLWIQSPDGYLMEEEQ